MCIEPFADREKVFYASVYVSDGSLMFRESIPGVKKCPIALGVPIAYITHDVNSMRPMPLKYALATAHLRTAGASNLGDFDIYNKVHTIAKEETVPSWTMHEWDKNVFSNYLPCAILFEDAEALKYAGDDSGMYCSMSFNHEALKVSLTFV